MPVTTSFELEGGDALRKSIGRAFRKTGIDHVAVGFFANAKYPDGTPVAAVAAWNEFGTRRIPERPFFRAAIKKMDEELVETVRQHVDLGTNFRVDPRIGDIIGAQAQGIIQRTIATGSYHPNPPNAPVTIKRKGSTRTLIDTGKMRQSVTYRVNG